MNIVLPTSRSRASDAVFTIARDYGGLVYLLLDRFTGDALVDEIAAAELNGDDLWPLNTPLFDHAPDRSPLLLRLDYTRSCHAVVIEAALREAAQQATEPVGHRGVCAFLFSHAQPRDLQRALKARLLVRGDVRGERKVVYFRCFDPRVVAHLPRLLGDPTFPPDCSCDTWLGPVQRWCYFDRVGALCTIERRDLSQTNATFASRGLPSALAQALERIEIVNLAAAKLDLAPAQASDARLDALALEAQSAGLRSRDDQVCYVVHAVRTGAAFTARPDLSALIRAATTRDMPLEALLAQPSTPATALPS